MIIRYDACKSSISRQQSALHTKPMQLTTHNSQVSLPHTPNHNQEEMISDKNGNMEGYKRNEEIFTKSEKQI